jgi:hypothetical protein
MGSERGKKQKKLTLTRTSKRKQALQLQIPRHTRQASATAASTVLGYLWNTTQIVFTITKTITATKNAEAHAFYETM